MERQYRQKMFAAALLLGLFSLPCLSRPALAGTPDFTIGNPGRDSCSAGQSASFSVKITPKSGFNSNVALSISGLPAGAAATFSPASFALLNSTKTSTLTIFTDAATPPGSYVLPVTVTGGGITHSADAKLVVKSSNKAYVVLSATPDTQAVQQGQTTTYSVMATGFNGYASPVTLSVSGLPSGASASFAPNPIASSAAGTNSTLTITTTSVTPTGTYFLTISGTVSSKIVAQAALTLDVTFAGGNAAAGIYILTAINGTLVHMDDLAGTNTTSLPFLYATSVIVGPDNRIYVAKNQRSSAPAGICRFDDMTGANMVSFGTYGTGPGQFRTPEDIWVAPDGRIYVADSDTYFGGSSAGRIIRMDDFAGNGWTEFKLPAPFTPRSVTVGPDGRIYFADTTSKKVYRIDDMSGANLVAYGAVGCVDQFNPATWSPGPVFCLPWKVRFGPDNRLYVADQGDHTLLQHGNYRIVSMAIDDLTGGSWSYYGVPNSENSWGDAGNPYGLIYPPGHFDSVYGVAIGPDGHIYVPDPLSGVVVGISDMTGAGWATSGTRYTGYDAPHDPFDVFVK